MKKFVQILIVLAMVAIIAVSTPILIGMYRLWDNANEMKKENVYQETKDRRFRLVKEKFSLIKEVEFAYKDKYKEYTQNWDELMSFIKTDSIKKNLYTGSLTDKMIESGMTEKEALKKGIIKKNIVTTSVIDYIFKNKEDIDKLKFIIDDELISLSSNTDNQIQTLTVSAHNDIILKGLNLESIKEMNGNIIRINRYPGLKMEMTSEKNCRYNY